MNETGERDIQQIIEEMGKSLEQTQESDAKKNEISNQLIREYISLLLYLREKVDQIPQWIPVLKPLLSGKMKEIEFSVALMLGIDLDNPDLKVENFSDRVELAGIKLGESLFGQVQALYEILALVGTGGTVTAGETVVQGLTTEKLMKFFELAQNGEGAKEIIKNLPEALNNLPDLLSSNQQLVEKVSPYLKIVSKLTEKVLENDKAKEALVKWLGTQDWMQELHARLKSGEVTLEQFEQKVREVDTEIQKNLQTTAEVNAGGEKKDEVESSLYKKFLLEVMMPMFASEESIKRRAQFNIWVESIKSQFPGLDLVGIVHGSVGRGHAVETSDTDAVVLYDDPALSETTIDTEIVDSLRDTDWAIQAINVSSLIQQIDSKIDFIANQQGAEFYLNQELFSECMNLAFVFGPGSSEDENAGKIDYWRAKIIDSIAHTHNPDLIWKYVSEQWHRNYVFWERRRPGETKELIKNKLIQNGEDDENLDQKVEDVFQNHLNHTLPTISEMSEEYKNQTGKIRKEFVKELSRKEESKNESTLNVSTFQIENGSDCIVIKGDPEQHVATMLLFDEGVFKIQEDIQNLRVDAQFVTECSKQVANNVRSENMFFVNLGDAVFTLEKVDVSNQDLANLIH